MQTTPSCTALGPGTEEGVALWRELGFEDVTLISWLTENGFAAPIALLGFDSSDAAAAGMNRGQHAALRAWQARRSHHAATSTSALGPSPSCIPPHGRSADIVSLSIGGVRFVTTRQTLLGRGENYFSGILPSSNRLSRAPDGAHLIRGVLQVCWAAPSPRRCWRTGAFL
jgi:hypothetical protein